MVELRIGQIWEWTTALGFSAKIELVEIHNKPSESATFKCLTSMSGWAVGQKCFFYKSSLENSNFKLIKDIGKYCFICNYFYNNAENNNMLPSYNPNTPAFSCWECDIKYANA